MIDVFEIEDKQKPVPLGVASPQDFTYRHAGELDPAVLVTDPTVSLYCLDHPARRALFVQVPEGIDITKAPFLYLSQYDHAYRLLSVPYDVFHQVAAGIELHAPLVLIHSTGRAGSTLLSKAFAEMASVTSLSEPDVYTQAVAMRLAGVEDAEIQQILFGATKFLFNPAFTRNSTLHVVKFRSFCIELGDLLYGAFPDARSLFLYRGLADNIESMMRAFVRGDLDPESERGLIQWLASMTPLLAEELDQRPHMDAIEILALSWLSTVHAYVRLHQQGVPMLAVRYEELIADRRGMLSTILAYLGLPANEADRALRAFERDSQAGSPVSREEAGASTTSIDARGWQLVQDLVRRYPIDDATVPAASVAVP